MGSNLESFQKFTVLSIQGKYLRFLLLALSVHEKNATVFETIAFLLHPSKFSEYHV